MPEWTDEYRHHEMRDVFERVNDACPDRIHEMCYSFGGHAVRMRVVGDRLAALVALPFTHLQGQGSNPSHPRLTIDLWDRLETGIAAAIDVAPDSLGVSSRFSASADERFMTSVLQQSITSFDRQEGHIVGVALDAGRLSLYECGRPLHVPLSLWYNDHDIPLVHAALVSYRGDGILLAGSSGTGKTTSSLSCIAAGFDYLADDLVGLEIVGDGSPWGHSVYGSAFVDEGTLHRFPALGKHAVSGKYSHEDKHLVFVSEAAPAKLASKARIRVVVLVRISDVDRIRIQPATKSESLLTMARSTLQSGALSSGRRGFDLLGRLSDDVPSFWLELGRDSEDIPHRLRALLVGHQDATEWRDVWHSTQ